MAGVAQMTAVTIDCPDPGVLADFYSKLTGWEIVYSDDTYVYVAGDGAVRLGFQRVQEEYNPPRWPSQTVPQQLHIDFKVESIEEAERQALALGATKPDFQAGDDNWHTLLDPAGHPFDLSIVA